MTHQEQITHIQHCYKNWLDLHKKLEQAQQDLQQSIELMKEMEKFYFDGAWTAIYEEIEQGQTYQLTTDGEYSVMSEDTLWNAFHEQQVLMWQFLRTAVKALDKDMPEFYAPTSAK